MHRETYQQILDNLFDGVYMVDRTKKITYWSQSAERITGYSSAEVIGISCSDNLLRHIDYEGRELCIEGCPLDATLQDGSIRNAKVFLHHRKGHRVPIRVVVIPVLDEFGEISGAVEIFQDTSSRSDLLQELELLRQEVLQDELTAVGNRRMLEISLREGITLLTREQLPFGLVFIDIDHFKEINDTYGHAMGDKILTMAAKTISNLARPLDTVSRFGGDEFAVVVPKVTKDVLGKIAERIRFFMEKSWLMDAGEKIQVTVSIGAVMAEAGETEEKIIQRADAAMYLSKKNGRNRVTCADTEPKKI